MQRHRHREFIRFLNAVEREVPAGKTVHAVLDNCATHKRSKVIEWLGRHPRRTFHFTPTSASWLNAGEASSPCSPGVVSRAAFSGGVVDLQAAINRFVIHHNLESKPLRLDRRSLQNHRRTRAPGAGVNPLMLAIAVRRSAPNVRVRKAANGEFRPVAAVYDKHDERLD
jgi:hypothetical protein